MFNLDAFIIRGHEKVIGHYRLLCETASSETERRNFERRVADERAGLDPDSTTRLGGTQRAAA